MLYAVTLNNLVKVPYLLISIISLNPIGSSDTVITTTFLSSLTSVDSLRKETLVELSTQPINNSEPRSPLKDHLCHLWLSDFYPKCFQIA